MLLLMADRASAKRAHSAVVGRAALGPLDVSAAAREDKPPHKSATTSTMRNVRRCPLTCSTRRSPALRPTTLQWWERSERNPRGRVSHDC